MGSRAPPADATVTEKERDALATLAVQLGLGAGEARAIERAVSTAGPSGSGRSA